ncbi:MAG: ABC transporter permease [Gemmatimonadaceae bacterium]
MDSLLHDLRFALRTLRRNIGFTVAAVLTLALGIGANAAIFGLVNGILLKPLPYADPDRLVMVWGRYPDFGRTSTSLPDFRDWRDQATSFAGMAARHGTLFNLTGEGEPEQLRADRVTANFFETLGVRPFLGRDFRTEEERIGGDDDVVVLSHAFWQRRFAGDRAMVGQPIQLSGRPYTVIGVAPEGFSFGPDVDLWAPARVDTTANRRSEYLTVFGRLEPGVPLQRAQAEMAAVLARLAEQYPETNGRLQSEVIGLRDDVVGGARSALFLFAGAVGLVLLIACANVANLLLARASSRSREIAVRMAIGAGRGRLMRQIITESVLLALLGAGVGLLIAVWGIEALRVAGDGLLPRMGEVRVDGAVVLFSVIVACVTGVVFGFAPAMRLSGGAMHAALKEGARGASAGAAGRLRNGLVLGEVAVALLLLVGAGLLMRSFQRLTEVDVGFDARGVLTYELLLPRARFPEPAQLPQFYDRLLESSRALPGVQAAAVADGVPMGGAGYITFAIEGRTPPPDAGEDLQPFAVSPEHFAALGIPLRSGRLFTTGDAGDAPDVVVINEEMARRFFDGRDPVGRRITFGDPADTAATWRTVVGVVGNVAQEGVTAAPYPQLYLPIAQNPSRAVVVELRTAGDPMALAAAARQVVRSMDAELPVTEMRTMEDRVAADLARPRINVVLIGIFAGVALLLAAVGIYGVISYTVVQRTREIGIRMALGANTEDVRRLVVRQGMTPVLGGIGIGLVAAVVASRLLRSLVYGVSTTDPLTFVLVALFLAAVALLATYLPARHATRVQPVIALRED